MNHGIMRISDRRALQLGLTIKKAPGNKGEASRPAPTPNRPAATDRQGLALMALRRSGWRCCE